MYPYIHIGSLQLGTFGLLLWLAAVAAMFQLYRSFTREGVDADALNIVAMVVIAGILGAKAWHELQDPTELVAAMRFIVRPGWSHPLPILFGFLRWFQAGFAWYGGMLAGIAMLMWQGAISKPNAMTGHRAAIRMLDLAAPAAAIGYGVGRLGCLMSGDGDYGKNTTSWIGVHMAPNALDPPHPLNARVLPTPIFEFVVALALAWVLWRLAGKPRPLGWLTGVYLILTGTARFIVEFWRINPLLYFNKHLSNAQVASLGSVLVGIVIVIAVRRNAAVGGPAPMPEPAPA